MTPDRPAPSPEGAAPPLWPTTPDQDAEHLKLLSLFHTVLGCLAALFALFPMVHLAAGLGMLLTAPTAASPGEGLGAALMGWCFVVFAGTWIVLALTYAGLLIVAGKSLARRTRYTFCLVVAAVSCAFMPFGTLLGVFTILVLMRPSVKALFAGQAQAPPPKPAISTSR